MKTIFDIECNNLLAPALDYKALPFKLKSDFRVWCVVFRDVDTNEVISKSLDACTKETIKEILKDTTELIGHNIVNYDLPVMKLKGLMDYDIAYPDCTYQEEIKPQCTLFGKPVEITDTLIWSKLLNPDRYKGHSLEVWGERLGNKKTEFNDYSQYTEKMLAYCIQDTNVNLDVYKILMKEKGDHSWGNAYQMERKLADLTLNQEIFGFDFNEELAYECIEELTQLMEERAIRVNPILPMKKMTQAKLKEYTPPKGQFKGNGEFHANLIKFAAKHNAELDLENRKFIYKNRQIDLPMSEPLEEYEPASIEDIDVVKGYLLSLGWVPSEIKQRDLVKNTDKSIKTKKQIIETIDRYVKQTEESLFKEIRLEELSCKIQNLKTLLMSKINGNKPIYAPTTPPLQVGVEKEICPNLISMGDKALFVKDVTEYFTYRHRKNSIIGKAVDEDGEPITGFLSNIREDGRIPTPADTLGANTGRYRHKIVCNIPRVTSLYGEKMRSMFGAGPDFYQLGFDFASLEARIQGHYCLPYTEGDKLAEALVAEKPNDIHSINARKLGIDRTSAKSFTYASLYGAQAKKLAKMLGISVAAAQNLYDQFWDAVPALKELKQKLEKHWESNGKKWILGMDGRKLITRSKHSLLNVLFQSGGAIVAKWSLVCIAKILQEKNLLGNPFTDTKDCVKVWQMIVNHDEAQYAVHKSLLKIKNFLSKEEAQEAIVEGCSAIGHGSKGYYIGYPTEPVVAISEGIKQACGILKTKVPMGFEWVPGLHWGQCH